MRIVAVGATGFIGRPLCAALVGHGHTVQVLSRRGGSGHLPAGVDVLRWDLGRREGAWVEAVQRADAVVNLAGESIAAGRWTRSRKARILASRLESTQAVVDAIAAAPAAQRPAVLVSASAIGYYGDAGERTLVESSPPGEDFLADVCTRWEAAAVRAEGLGVRVVTPRIGLVLGRGGGALPPLLRLYRLFVGGPLGSGHQWWSWVHLDDVVGVIEHAITTPDVAGAVNATAPNPVRMAELGGTLGRVLRRPSVVPAPAFALRIVLGQMADSLLLNSQRVLPEATLAGGYRFRHPHLEPALRSIVTG